MSNKKLWHAGGAITSLFLIAGGPAVMGPDTLLSKRGRIHLTGWRSLGVSALILYSLSVHAQRAGGPIPFDVLDANDDGKVTLAEFKENFAPPPQSGRTPNHERLFGRWDADSDGELTAEEFANRPRRRQQN